MPKDKNSLFNIEVKIQGELLNIPVYENDTHQTLIERFCQNHAIRKDYQNVIKDKVIQSLLKILKSNQLEDRLKQKVSNFINNQSKPKQSKSASSNKTPYKLLVDNSNKQKNSSPHPRKDHKPQQQSKQRKAKVQRVQKIQKVQKVQKLQKVNKNSSKFDGSRKSIVKNILDDDLIKAYQTIFNKCKDKNMKQMAKQYLLNDKNSKRRSEQKQQISEFMYPQVSNNSYIHNQQKSSNRDNSLILGSKLIPNQRKYDYQRFSSIDQGLLSNLYSRDVLSYQRLAVPISENYSMVDNYDYPSRNRSVSNLKRTRKYRYLID